MKNKLFSLLLVICMLSVSACSNTSATKNTEDTATVETEAVETEAAEPEASGETGEATKDIYAMDTYMSMTAYGEHAQEAVDAAAEEIQRLDALWSVGNGDSEISQVNEKKTLILSEETGDLIEESLELYKETDGVFDITIYPLMQAWGFTTQDYRVPGEDELKELLSHVDAGVLDYDAETRTLTMPDDVEIDLGGIAKGYTSARVMEIFGEYGITSGIVSLGGNVQTWHSKIDGSAWRVGIQNPDNTVDALKNEDYIGVLSVTDKAIITSGGYERYFEQDGVTYHHILDPADGYPADSGLISVTIVSDDGTLADGLSTSLFIMGKDKALEFWRAHQDEFDTILVESDGAVTITGGLTDCFQSNLKYDIAE